ncbi:MAG TPA: hypothetical protein VID96_02030 [Xanthobacteraceae bacterium]
MKSTAARYPDDEVASRMDFAGHSCVGIRGVLRLDYHLLIGVAEEAIMAAKTNGRRGVSDATHDVQQDLQALREDLGVLAEEVTGLMSSTGSQALDEVKDRIGRIRSGLDDVMSDAGARGRDALRDASENLSSALEQQVNERPLATLAIALGLGFILGATWRK